MMVVAQIEIWVDGEQVGVLVGPQSYTTVSPDPLEDELEIKFILKEK